MPIFLSNVCTVNSTKVTIRSSHNNWTAERAITMAKQYSSDRIFPATGCY